MRLYDTDALSRRADALEQQRQAFEFARRAAIARLAKAKTAADEWRDAAWRYMAAGKPASGTR